MLAMFSHAIMGLWLLVTTWHQERCSVPPQTDKLNEDFPYLLDQTTTASHDLYPVIKRGLVDSGIEGIETPSL